jgi:hypothetical protein
MPVEIITSLQNPRLKRLVKLRDRRPRDEEQAFLVEGYREVRRALEKNITLTELYYSRDWFLGENEPALLAQAEAAGAKLFELSKDAFAKVAYRERPDGLLAVAPQWTRTLCGPEALPCPVPPDRRGDREARQPRHDPAQRRRRGMRRRHCLRSRDRPLQPECGQGLHGRPLLSALRRRRERGRAAWLKEPRDPERRHHAGGRGALLGLRLARPARDHHGKRAIRPQRLLAQEFGPAREDTDGGPGRFAERGHGGPHHALRGGAAARPGAASRLPSDWTSAAAVPSAMLISGSIAEVPARSRDVEPVVLGELGGDEARHRGLAPQPQELSTPSHAAPMAEAAPGKFSRSRAFRPSATRRR